jgi:hypothetical protein
MVFVLEKGNSCLSKINMRVPILLYEVLSKIEFLVVLKKKSDQIERWILRRKQIQRRNEWQYNPQPVVRSYHFYILCVKRAKYIEMAIEQINSLHYFNSYHVFDIFCDDTLLSYFKKNKYKLDYPDRVIGVLLTKKASKPWQIYKIQTLVHAMKHDGIVVDADMYWFGDLYVRQWKALFFTRAYSFKDQARERQLLDKVFGHPEWQEWSHFVSALVYVPYTLYSKNLENKLLKFTKMILNSSYDFLNKQEDRDMVYRLAEEIAINLAFQSEFRPEQITTLKAVDSPGDKNIVQALYYGAMNKIME